MQQFNLEQLEVICDEDGREYEDIVKFEQQEFIQVMLRLHQADSSRKWRFMVKLLKWSNQICLSIRMYNTWRILSSGCWLGMLIDYLRKRSWRFLWVGKSSLTFFVWRFTRSIIRGIGWCDGSNKTWTGQLSWYRRNLGTDFKHQRWNRSHRIGLRDRIYPWKQGATPRLLLLESLSWKTLKYLGRRTMDIKDVECSSVTRKDTMRTNVRM